MAIATEDLREGSTAKRQAVLSAARELFLRDGYDRTSVDTVSARAGVSKRTVYDYFGDKRRLLLNVIERTAESLTSTIRAALEVNLTEVSDVEASLIGLARGITASALGSTDYAALIRLVSMESASLPELRTEHWLALEPEEELAVRFQELERQGLLFVPNPRLAADHFVALTLAPSAKGLSHAAGPDAAQTEVIIVEGVRAFLRAYSPQWSRGDSSPRS